MLARSVGKSASGRKFAVSLAALVLAGCGIFSGNNDPRRNWTVEQYYEDAKDELSAGNYEAAIKTYEQLEARYPYGRYAQQAQLDTAYAHYKRGESAEAVAACDRFIKTYPNNPVVDYAYYLKGLSLFNADLGLFGAIAGTDLSDRDPKSARESFDTFKQLVTRFPESRYAEDARQRMDYLINSLAQHQVHVARYYLQRGAPLAAVNRAQEAVKNYPRAPATEEALAIMVRGYDQLGLPELANDAERLLAQNFPRSRFLATGFAQKPWWKWW